MKAEWADQPPPEQHGIPGKALAAQREAMGWSVEQVADQLKLAVRQVVALEQGDYANLPGPAVVRGFVRAYAKVVKLDAAPLVAQIALDTPPVGDASGNAPVRRERPASFSQVRFPTHGKRQSKLPWGWIGAAVVVLAGAGVAWQLGYIPKALLPGMMPASTAPAASGTLAGGASVQALPPPASAPAAAAGTAPPAPAVTPESRAAEALPPVISNAVPLISVPPASTPSSAAAGAGTPAGVTPAGVAPAPAASVAAAAATPAAANNALVLTVREDSWIEVRQPKGPKLFSGLVKGGSIETVTVPGPATLIVGRPAAVDATLRGQPVALPSAPGAKTARVNLP